MSFFITQILCVSCWIRFLVYFVTVNKFELCFIKKLSPLGKVEQRTFILKVFFWQAFCNVTTVAVKVQRKLFSTTLFFPVYCVGIEVKFLHFKCFILHVTVSALWRKSKWMWCFAISQTLWVKNEWVGQSICCGTGDSTLHTVRLCLLCGEVASVCKSTSMTWDWVKPVSSEIYLESCGKEGASSRTVSRYPSNTFYLDYCISD